MPRLLLVSNRLPVTVKVEAKQVKVTASSGGLATGLRGPHERTGGLWLGWPGDMSKLSPEQHAHATRELEALRTVPIQLSAHELARYYESFANGVLWPLFHYRTDRIPMDGTDWETYKRVNERFAQVVARHYQPGDLIWVHDYQLCLVPKLLREALPGAKIGFFLHIPFPATDIFRILPWHQQILEGMLGADLVGFHTYGYLRHFARSVVRGLGRGVDVNRVHHDGRSVTLGVFPMGVDFASFDAIARTDELTAQARAARGDTPDLKILLGIDRLDYTKGIPRRLLAMERLLEREPKLRNKVRLIQVAVPSREKVTAYADFRRNVDETVGRINGLYGSVAQAPIHYLYRSFSQQHVAALYRAADVMLVTPLRDGMNLVAKEFVSTRVDGDGVLVLSEFAGAFSELGEALTVNPFDIEGMAAVYKRALTMPEAERRARMKTLRARVEHHDVHRWAESFITELETLPSAVAPVRVALDAAGRRSLASELAASDNLVLLLDYDGTLRELQQTPELAAPTPEILELLEALGQRPKTRVYIVSGRPASTLQEWFGHLPIGLAAEHGAWMRESGAEAWMPLRELRTGWKDSVRPIFEEFAHRTPGARLEEKSATLAWHYRQADPEFGPVQANELAAYLIDLLANEPVQVIPGNKVVEVRQLGIHKGIVVKRVLERGDKALVFAMGDDRTDEDLFAALPEGGISVRVGDTAATARFRVADPTAARDLLRAIVGERT